MKGKFNILQRSKAVFNSHSSGNKRELSHLRNSSIHVIPIRCQVPKSLPFWTLNRKISVKLHAWLSINSAPDEFKYINIYPVQKGQDLCCFQMTTTHITTHHHHVTQVLTLALLYVIGCGNVQWYQRMLPMLSWHCIAMSMSMSGFPVDHTSNSLCGQNVWWSVNCVAREHS